MWTPSDADHFLWTHAQWLYRSIGLDVEQNGFIWLRSSKVYVHSARPGLLRAQGLILFAAPPSVFMPMAAESVSRVDDVEIVTLRRIALDSVDVPGLRPVDAPDDSSDIRVETPQEFLLDPEICAVPSLPANELGARREALSIPIAYHICQRIFFGMRVAEPSSMQRE